jgi:hypothetical protein
MQSSSPIRTLCKEFEDRNKFSSSLPASGDAVDLLSSAFQDLEEEELLKLEAWGSQRVQDVQKKMAKATDTTDKKGSAIKTVLATWKGKSYNASDYPDIFKELILKSAKSKLPNWYMDLAKDELISVDAIIKCIADS